MQVQTVTGSIGLDQLGRTLMHQHLFTDFVPMLKNRGLREPEIASILDDDPRRFFAGDALPLSNAG